jgi:hypothetical protein
VYPFDLVVLSLNPYLQVLPLQARVGYSSCHVTYDSIDVTTESDDTCLQSRKNVENVSRGVYGNLAGEEDSVQEPQFQPQMRHQTGREQSLATYIPISTGQLVRDCFPSRKVPEPLG